MPLVTRIRRLAQTLAGLELWVVALCVAAGAIASRVLPVVLAVAGLLWLIRWAAWGRLTVRTPGDWAIVLLGLMALVTLWATALPEVTRSQVLQLAASIALCYAIANWVVTEKRLRALVLGLIGLGLLLALTAPVSVQWMTGSKLTFIPEAIYRRLPLLLPDPIHPNVMAGALVVVLPLAWALLLFAWRELRGLERAIGAAAGLLIPGVLVFTKSRGALLGMAAALVVLVALRWRRGWLVVPVGILVAALGAWRLGPARVVEALAATQSLGGLDGRLEVWSRALYMLQDFPFTGIGMGTFKQVANAMYPFFLAGPDADVPHAHNLLLQVGVDLGLPGLVAWLALFLLVTLAAWQVYRRRTVGQVANSPYLTGLGAGLLASQVALAVHGLTDAATWGTRPAVIVWALWGLAMAAGNLAVRPPEIGRDADAV